MDNKLIIEYIDGSIGKIEINNGIIGREMFASDTSIRSVTCPETLRKIDYNAFWGCLNLKRISFNAPLNDIMDNAFEWCTSLNEVIIHSIETIGYNAFRFCTSLQNIRIETNCKVVYSGAFNYCARLETASLPNSLEYIGKEVFSNCKSLRFVNIPGSCTVIGEKAFLECGSLAEINLPESLRYIKTSAFKGSGLKQITVPGTVEKIGDDSFSDCKHLEKVIVNDGVCRIGMGAFSNCSSLKAVFLPKTTDYIDEYAFANCSSLIQIDISNIKTIYDEAFSQCGNITEAVISSVEELYDNSFLGCVSLEQVTVPLYISEGENPFRNCNSIKKVIITDYEDSNSYSIDDLFDSDAIDCIETIVIKQNVNLDAITNHDIFYSKNLKNITADERNAFFSTIDGVLYNKDKTILIRCPAQKKSVIVPNTVKHIEEGAFRKCKKLTQIILPKSLETIGDFAFTNAKSLVEINIPKSVTSFGYDAFEGTSWLENKRNLIIVNDIVVDAKKCTGSIIVSGGSVIGKGAFEGSPVRKVIISDDIKEIKGGAFFYCENLVSVKFSNSVKRIEDLAFSSCNLLTQISLPLNLEYISQDVFVDSQRLEYIDIDGTGGSYFSYDGVIYKGSLSEGNAVLWIAPPAKKTINIPDGVVSIEDMDIYSRYLGKLYIPDSVKFTDEYCEKILDYYCPFPYLTIYCRKNSDAERFARKCSVNYELY